MNRLRVGWTGAGDWDKLSVEFIATLYVEGVGVRSSDDFECWDECSINLFTVCIGIYRDQKSEDCDKIHSCNSNS